MTNKDSEYERLARYLTGNSSKKESWEIESMIINNPSYAAMVDSFKKIMDANISSSNLYNADKSWKKLSKEIEYYELKQTKASGKQSIYFRKNMKKPLRPRMNWLIRTAAVLMLTGFVSYLIVLYMGNLPDQESIVMHEKVTEKGQRSNIILNDGSHIQLNSESRLSFPDEFDADSRIVRINGEAYFSIAQDDRPFYIYADEALIQIHGTELNVRSYNEKDIEVVVASGQVSVNYVAEADDKAVYLEKGDMVILSRHRNVSPIVNRNVDLQRHIGWLTNHIVFDNTPLDEVAETLERFYGVDIAFTDPELSKLRISADFEEKSIYAVLQVMELVLDLEHKVEGRIIYLSKKSSD